jgi:hypothetical protein
MHNKSVYIFITHSLYPAEHQATWLLGFRQHCLVSTVVSIHLSFCSLFYIVRHLSAIWPHPTTHNPPSNLPQTSRLSSLSFASSGSSDSLSGSPPDSPSGRNLHLNALQQNHLNHLMQRTSHHQRHGSNGSNTSTGSGSGSGSGSASGPPYFFSQPQQQQSQQSQQLQPLQQPGAGFADGASAVGKSAFAASDALAQNFGAEQH